MAVLQSMASNVDSVFGWIAQVVQNNPIPAAFVTLLSVLSAVWTNHKNRVATIFGHSMQAITHLDHRWDSIEMRRFRRWAATYLLRQHKSSLGVEVNCTSQEREGLKAVLNFLETVGCFVRMGAISRRTAWQLFGSSTQLYVEAARKDIFKYQQPRETLYTEMSYLYAIARVEEVCPALPGTWMWMRITAFRLTIGGVAKEGRWLGKRAARIWNLVASLLTGKVAELHVLAPLFSDEEIRNDLTAESIISLIDEPAMVSPTPSLQEIFILWVAKKLLN